MPGPGLEQIPLLRLKIKNNVETKKKSEKDPTFMKFKMAADGEINCLIMVPESGKEQDLSFAELDMRALQVEPLISHK